MLNFFLPDGSLEKPVLDLFSRAGVEFIRKSYRFPEMIERNFSGSFEKVFRIRPQESPSFLANGVFDLAITGQDWVAETRSDVVEVTTLPVSRSGSEKVRIALAVTKDSSILSSENLTKSSIIATEYPSITKRWLDKKEIRAKVIFSYGGTEGKLLIPVADAITELVDSGRSLKENGMRIVEEIFTSMTCLIASEAAWNNSTKRNSIEYIAGLLDIGVSSLQAEKKAATVRLITCNIAAEAKDDVLLFLPSDNPTVNELACGGLAIQALVPLTKVNQTVAGLRDRGATSILVQTVQGFVP